MEKINSGRRMPSWLKSKLPAGANYRSLRRDLKQRNIHTVCEEAKCPNLGECWEQKTATIMILGNTCTRNCRFCNVQSGNPGGFIDPDEIDNSLEMVDLMGLRYLVITSVTRDDLPDHGAGHFARLISRINSTHPDTKVEVLVPDFGLKESSMDRLGNSDPFVIAHNIETVSSLTKKIRDPRAGYQTGLKALKYYKSKFPHISTKSSLMVGMGETMEEIEQTMNDLIEAKVDILTIGQYLRPSKNNLEIDRFYTPAQFEELKTLGLKKGFSFVASGPLVRSSYKAADYLLFLERMGK